MEAVIVIFLLIGFIIWLIYKLSKEKKSVKALTESNNSLLNQNKIISSENSKLIADNALLEAEHLKFQLQPHTLGNVVSTLNAIAKNLHRGTESLAESLNYILYKGNAHLVSVEDELSFIKKYINLNQLLYSDIISVSLDDLQVNIKSTFFNSPCIPHLISAYLIENAYKHGDKTHPEFLKIKLTLSENHFEMTVTNKLNPKPTYNKNGGIGLQNMEKRLALLLSDKYEIQRSSDEHEYRITLNIQLNHA